VDTKLYLIKQGEIALKGQNRNLFEKQLKDNIKSKLRPYHNVFSRQKGRMFIEIDQSAPLSHIKHALSTTFGIVGYSQALRCSKNMDDITQVALTLSHQSEFIDGISTFKVETVRADKGFPLTSYEISAHLGAAILQEHPQLKVNVRTPDRILYVEVRDKVYLYSSQTKGLGGLPVSSAGKAMLMLSGGIDSPVASYMMAKRGLKQEAIYFHAYPYTSDEAKEKVLSLAKILSPYLQGLTVHVVPFTECQLYMKAHAPEEQQTLIMRAAMVQLSEKLAMQRGCKALITGEALSQVASQTIESLNFTNSMASLTVLRPLVGMDKVEIIDIARQIGTYETSILPYEDCCTIFSPKHPLVKPDVEFMRESYFSLNLEALIDKALQEVETVFL
jgi:thiamine biosynthesis protein ThiI